MGELSRSSSFCPFVPFLFILMQYCNGGSLDDLIWHDGNVNMPKALLPVSHIWCFLVDLLFGLQHIHRQGILHRDLKPTNILLQWPAETPSKASPSCPRALLGDLGTAALLGETPEGSPAGYTGTVEYTPPELLGANAACEFSEKSDMWSLGVVLYAMCFSSLPCFHEDPSVVKRLILQFTSGQRSSESHAADGLPVDPTCRLGSLRLIISALLTLDMSARPSTTDLLDNSMFRAEVVRNQQDITVLPDNLMTPQPDSVLESEDMFWV